MEREREQLQRIEGIIIILEQRNKRLTRGLCFMLGLLLLMVIGTIFRPKSVRAEQVVREQVKPDSILRVRGLVVVDERGTERVSIGAPAPDPLILGKRVSRGDSFAGVLVFDAEGNERGGYGTDDSGTVFLSLDEVGQMVGIFRAGPVGGVSLNLTGRGDQSSVSIGAMNTGSYLQLGRRGKIVFQQPEAEKGKN